MSASASVAAGGRGALLRAVRAAGIGGLAGGLSGAAWGLLARGAMRLVARAMRRLPSFSLEGTFLIVLLGVVVGAAIGVLYAGARALMPWGRRWKALALALALLLVLGGLLVSGPLAAEGSPDVLWLAVPLFGATLLAWGGLLELLYHPLDRRLLRGGEGRLAAALSWATLAAAPLLAAAVFAAQALGVFEE